MRYLCICVVFATLGGVDDVFESMVCAGCRRCRSSAFSIACGRRGTATSRAQNKVFDGAKKRRSRSDACEVKNLGTTENRAGEKFEFVENETLGVEWDVRAVITVVGWEEEG